MDDVLGKRNTTNTICTICIPPNYWKPHFNLRETKCLAWKITLHPISHIWSFYHHPFICPSIPPDADPPPPPLNFATCWVLPHMPGPPPNLWVPQTSHRAQTQSSTWRTVKWGFKNFPNHQFLCKPTTWRQLSMRVGPALGSVLIGGL